MRALWTAVAGRRRPGGPALGEQLSALPRLVRATVAGRYPGLTRGRLALLALALGYVVSPVDLVPESALLLLGLADDAVVLAWLAGALISETEAFLTWEAGGRPRGTAPGDVVLGEIVR